MNRDVSISIKELHSKKPDVAEPTEVESDRLVRVDLSSLEHCTTDPTKCAVEMLFPCGHVTLEGGHGGSGKSILALTIAAHVATGKPWAGLKSDQGRVVFISLEDPGDLARYRLRRVCDEYNLPHAEVAEFLTILDGSNVESALAVEVSDAGPRRLIFTATMDEIEVAAEGCRLLVIDNASDAFAANENDRRLVRSFIRRLAQIARKWNCAVLLLAHIDKTAARYGSAGNSYSGSTAWHNSVRSRLALIEDKNGLSLVHEKANLGKKIEPIRLEWTEHGVLVPVATTGSAVVERDAADDANLLAAMLAAIQDGATIPTARSGPCTSLSVLTKYPDLPKELRGNRFWTALTRLERAGRVSRERYKNQHRHDRERLVVCANSCAPNNPHTPSALARANAAPIAPVVRQSNRRGTDALTQTCPRCDGAGCKWCKAENNSPMEDFNG